MALPSVLTGHFLLKFRTKICKPLTPVLYKYTGERWQQSGNCSFGDKCQYSHDKNWPRRPLWQVKYNPDMCEQSETCTEARTCMKAHTSTEQLYHPSIYKRSVCKSFVQSGRCGVYYCPFAHGDDDLIKPNLGLEWEKIIEKAGGQLYTPPVKTIRSIRVPASATQDAIARFGRSRKKMAGPFSRRLFQDNSSSSSELKKEKWPEELRRDDTTTRTGDDEECMSSSECIPASGGTIVPHVEDAEEFLEKIRRVTLMRNSIVSLADWESRDDNTLRLYYEECQNSPSIDSHQNIGEYECLWFVEILVSGLSLVECGSCNLELDIRKDRRLYVGVVELSLLENRLLSGKDIDVRYLRKVVHETLGRNRVWYAPEYTALWLDIVDYDDIEIIRKRLKPGLLVEKSIVWMLGIVLHRSIFGRHPFDTDPEKDDPHLRRRSSISDAGNLHQRILRNQRCYSKAEMQTEVCRIIDGMLEIDPLKRLSFNELFSATYHTMKKNSLFTDTRLRLSSSTDWGLDFLTPRRGDKYGAIDLSPTILSLLLVKFFMEVSDDDIRPISGIRRRRKKPGDVVEETESPVEEDTSSPKKAKTVLTKRARVKKISTSTDSDDASDEDDCFSGSDVEAHVSPNTRDRDRKSRLIGQVLSRWWYVMVRWPPKDFDYASELSKRTLRQVSFDNWEYEDDIDAFGYTKVYEITHFPGVYRNPKGEIIDLRPTEGKPCYSNLVKKSELELYEMLYTALTNQISDLGASPYISTDKSVIEKIREDLTREMRFVQTNLHRLKSGTLC